MVLQEAQYPREASWRILYFCRLYLWYGEQDLVPGELAGLSPGYCCSGESKLWRGNEVRVVVSPVLFTDHLMNPTIQTGYIFESAVSSHSLLYYYNKSFQVSVPLNKGWCYRGLPEEKLTETSLASPPQQQACLTPHLHPVPRPLRNNLGAAFQGKVLEN